MARSIGKLFFELLADTKDLESAEKEVGKFTDKTKDSAKAINKAAASADTLADKEAAAAKEAEELYRNAKDVVDAHKKAAKEAATLAEAERIAADEASNIEKTFKGIGVLIPTIVAGFASLQAIQTIRELASQARDLENASKSLGVGVNTLSQYQYAFQQVKIDGDKVVDMFKDINERVGEYANTGGGELVDILKRTNLNINELINLSPDQQLLKIYDALEQIDGITQAEITAYLEQLVSDAALLQPLLADGAAELKRFREEGEELGVTLDTLEVQKLKDADEEIRKLSSSWTGLTNTLAIEFAPAMTVAISKLNEFTQLAAGNVQQIKHQTETNKLYGTSFESIAKDINATRVDMNKYLTQSAEEQRITKEGIELRLKSSRAFIEEKKQVLEAERIRAKFSKANQGFDPFGVFKRRSKNLSEIIKKSNEEIKAAEAAIKVVQNDVNNLGNADKTPVLPAPPAKPKQTFAQTQAAEENAQKLAVKKAAEAKREAARNAAIEKREKAAAARNAKRVAAQKAREDKRTANELKRAEEKKNRENKRAENQLKREQEKQQKLAEAEQKSIAASLDRVQSGLLTKQEKEAQAYAKALADLKTAEEAKIATLVPYHELRQRLEKDHQASLAQIKAEEQRDDLQIKDQAQHSIDNVVGGLTGFELEQENTQYQADLEALAVARELKLETIASYDEIERAIEQAHQDELLRIKANAERQALNNQIKNFRLQTKGQQAALGGMLDILKAAGQEQSDIYKVMFAASKAFAIAESVIKIQQGIAQASALPFPANLAAIGTVLSATAGIVSTIRGAQFEGRQYGGPTAPNTGYQVNETGVPEIYTQGGRDYLLTGSQRGKVTPLKSADKSSGGSNAGSSGGVVRITVNVDGQQQESIMTPRDVEEIALDVVTRKAGEVVGQDFSDANSKASQGLKNNYKVTASL